MEDAVPATPTTEAETLPVDVDIPAGDSRYAGFRIKELWAILIVWPDDDQETIAHVGEEDGRPVPLLATDERRMVTHLRPAVADIRKGAPDMHPRLVHFVIDSEE